MCAFECEKACWGPRKFGGPKLLLSSILPRAGSTNPQLETLAAQRFIGTNPKVFFNPPHNFLLISTVSWMRASEHILVKNMDENDRNDYIWSNKLDALRSQCTHRCGIVFVSDC